MGDRMGPAGYQELITALADAAPVALIAIRDGKIIYTNLASQQLTGQAAEDLDGMRFEELVVPEQRKRLKQDLFTGHSGEVTIHLRCREGSTCVVRLSSRQIQLAGDTVWVVTAVEQPTEAIFQAIADAVVVYGADGVVLQANPASTRLYGFNPTGYQQREIVRNLTIRHLDGTPISIEELPSTRVLRGERAENERMVIANRAGQERVVTISTAPMYQGSKLSGAVVVWHDVTETEHLLAENLRQRGLLEAMFEADPGGLALLAGPDLKFQIANSAYRAITPHPDLDPIGRTYGEIWPAAEGFSEREIFLSVLKHGEPVAIENNERRFPDGSVHYFSIHAQRIYWDGEPAVLDVLWDTTPLERARHLAEQSAEDIHRLAEELDAVINAMTEAVVIYDTDGKPVRTNPAALETYGFDPVETGREEMVRRLKITHLDESPIKLEDTPISRALRGEKVPGERLLLHPVEGQERIVLVSAAPMISQGRITGAVAVWRDVTEREQLLGLLEDEQARLQAVIRNAPEAIVMADASGQVVLANPAAEELYGGSIGLQASAEIPEPQFCYPDGTPFRTIDLPLTRAVREGKPQIGIEAVLQSDQGKTRSLLISAAPILDRRGRPTGAVAVFQDISQRKRAEETVRREAARMELLATLSQAFAEAGLYYPAVLGTISRRVAESIGDACVIRLVSDDGKWLDPVAFHHTDPQALAAYRSVLRASRKKVNENPEAMISSIDEPLVVLDMSLNDLRALDPASVDTWLEKYPVQNALLVPLRAQGRFIGTMTVVRNGAETPLTGDDQVFIQDLADRAALAIDNARLYAAETQRSRELQALHRAASALLGNLDLDSLLGQILETAQSAIPTAEKGVLHLSDRPTGELKVRAMLGYQNPTIERSQGHGHKDHDYLVRAVRQKQPLLISDVPDRNQPGQASGYRSAIVAPLVLGRRVLGALSLTSTRAAAFTEADLRLLVSLAATTTAAIQNALLHSEVQRLAVTDDLTEQYNRRGFFELGEREIERYQRFGRELSAIMLDIDHFKEINDTYGHAVGDQVLATLARRCRAHIRQVDILGRYGGEEFAILLPETDQSTAADIADRIRRSIATEPIATTQGPVSLSISMGVAMASAKTLTLSSLLDRADAALYQAKQNGRNRVELA